MPRASILEKIPSAILGELIARSEDRPGMTITEHTEWLAERGYKVSRSAVHRYLSARRQATADTSAASDDEPPADWSIRLGCLMVAAGYAVPGDKVDLLRTASELASWIKAPAAE